MATLRAFIAIELPSAVRASLGDVAAALAPGLPTGAVRWVRPEAMHLTLRFLGDTPTGSLPELAAALDTLAEGHAPFNLHLAGLGCFPNPRRPRVLWVGLAGDEARLAALKAGLDGALASLGRPPEGKPFRAHLTLGRVREEGGVRDFRPDVAVPELAVPVTSIVLMESELRPDGPRYTARHRAELSG
jgi:2'-5' RNA ligase